MEYGESCLVFVVLEVLEVGTHLRRIKHPFIDDGLIREGADVEFFDPAFESFVLRGLLGQEEFLVAGRVEIVRFGRQDLHDFRLGFLGSCPCIIVHGNFAPKTESPSFLTAVSTICLAYDWAYSSSQEGNNANTKIFIVV